METLSDLEDEYTMLLHNTGTVHPMTRSRPKRTESCCVLTDMWHNSSSFTYSVHESVQLHHFLLPLNVCGALSSVPIWKIRSWHRTVTIAPACPAIWYYTAALHSSKKANTRCCKGLSSKGFQQSDTKTVAVGNELHNEYNVIFIKYSCI